VVELLPVLLSVAAAEAVAEGQAAARLGLAEAQAVAVGASAVPLLHWLPLLLSVRLGEGQGVALGQRVAGGLREREGVLLLLRLPLPLPLGQRVGRRVRLALGVGLELPLPTRLPLAPALPVPRASSRGPEGLAPVERLREGVAEAQAGAEAEGREEGVREGERVAEVVGEGLGCSLLLAAPLPVDRLLGEREREGAALAVELLEANKEPVPGHMEAEPDGLGLGVLPASPEGVGAAEGLSPCCPEAVAAGEAVATRAVLLALTEAEAGLLMSGETLLLGLGLMLSVREALGQGLEERDCRGEGLVLAHWLACRGVGLAVLQVDGRADWEGLALPQAVLLRLTVRLGLGLASGEEEALREGGALGLGGSVARVLGEGQGEKE
jgi:hypothetical protein